MNRRHFLRGSLALAAFTPAMIHAAPAAASKPRPGTEGTAAAADHCVLTANIRVALPEDEAKGNGWNVRRDLCIDVIRAQKPDVICLQEVIRVQMRDLEKAFPDFGSFGFEGPEMDARLEGYQGIAKNPILYSRKRYELVTAGGFWLSETPHIPGSLSWDSARARHVNWVRLQDKATGRQFRVLSTHLDHVSQPAREEQIKLILAEAAVYSPDFPQVLAGDFNASRANAVLKLTIDAGWKDSFAETPGPRDDGFSTHAFLGDKRENAEVARKRGPIDFVMFKGPITAREWKLIRDSRDGKFPSDHYFLRTRLAI